MRILLLLLLSTLAPILATQSKLLKYAGLRMPPVSRPTFTRMWHVANQFLKFSSLAARDDSGPNLSCDGA